ncbi:MAG: DUF1302 family protein [Desulfatibacillum sp.]|nr:DUF1302 family protein [Desulfatibacillum sp.]
MHFQKHSLRALFITAFLSWIILVSPAALADGFDQAMDAFDNLDEEIVVDEEAIPESPSHFRLSGYGKLSTVVTYAQPAPQQGETDYRGLYRLRPELDAKLDVDIAGSWKARVGGRFWYDFAYDLKDRDDFTEPTLDEMETEAELWEAYIEGRPFKGLDLRLGRQIVVWGTSENIRVTDVINPLDLRESGMVDIEGLRLPTAMARADLTLGYWTITGLAIPEIRPALQPPYGGMYYPSDIQLPDDHPPVDSAGNMEYGASIAGHLPGWDISFYFADIYMDLPYLKTTVEAKLIRPPIFIPPATILPPIIQYPEFEYHYVRVQMYGASTAIALGNWLLKAEAAYFTGLKYFNEPNEDRDRFDGLLGLEYTGFTDTTISLDVACRYMPSYEEVLETAPDNNPESQPEAAVRIQRDFRNDTFHLTLLATALGHDGGDGWFARAESTYDWTDNLNFTLGIVGYGADDDGYFAYAKDNDCVFFDIKYSF